MLPLDLLSLERAPSVFWTYLISLDVFHPRHLPSPGSNDLSCCSFSCGKQRERLRFSVTIKKLYPLILLRPSAFSYPWAWMWTWVVTLGFHAASRPHQQMNILSKPFVHLTIDEHLLLCRWVVYPCICWIYLSLFQGHFTSSWSHQSLFNLFFMLWSEESF